MGRLGQEALWRGLSEDLVFYPKETEEHWRIIFKKNKRPRLNSE